MFVEPRAYDKISTQFSPNGRLYQVEYALETVRRGGLAVGIRTDNGVVLVAYEKKRRLQSEGFSQKISQVDSHIAAAASGYIPDARIQVNRARIIAQNLRMLYGEDASVENITKHVADVNQLFTQYGVVRPFAASIVLGGVDETGPVLCTTDPSGTYSTYDAVAIGSGSDRVTDYIEQHYNNQLNLDEACKLAIDCIWLAHREARVEDVEMALVKSKTKRVRRPSHKEVKAFMESLHDR